MKAIPITKETKIESYDLLISHVQDHVHTITLDRPKKLNALSIELIEQLSVTLLQAENNQDINLVILRGNGKAFCAGGDVAALAKRAKTGTQAAIQEGNFFMQRQYQLNHIAATLAKPSIAVWHKTAMGGGIGISIPLDFRIATETTMIAMPECGIAFFPDVGASYFLNRLRPGIGMYLALTGKRISGYQAVEYGLATHYIENAQIERALSDLAQCSAVQQGMHLTQVDAILKAHSKEQQSTLDLELISRVFTLPSLTEIMSKLSSIHSAWSEEALQSIQAGSPTAVHVTFELLTRAKSLSAEDCRALEYLIHQNFMRLPDFIEGVHAKLIEKPARAPRWSPTMQDCSSGYISSFFQQRDDTLLLRPERADPDRQTRFISL